MLPTEAVDIDLVARKIAMRKADQGPSFFREELDRYGAGTRWDRGPFLPTPGENDALVLDNLDHLTGSEAVSGHVDPPDPARLKLDLRLGPLPRRPLSCIGEERKYLL